MFTLVSLFSSVLFKSRYRFGVVAQTPKGFFGHDDLLSLSLNSVFLLSILQL
jgi:hypothetical protein